MDSSFDAPEPPAPGVPATDMTAGAAFRHGLRRVNGALLLACGLYALTLLVALPLSFALSDMIESHLGRSLMADAAAAGGHYDWWQEFSAQAAGLGTTFVPSIVGFGAVLDNLAALADNQPMAVTIAGVTVAWMVIWSFLSGGIIDRYARGRPTRSTGFFAACGTHFWRFIRLGALAWLAYFALFSGLHVLLFDRLYPWLARDLTVERTAFALRLGCYALFGLALMLCNVVVDYARIRIVVEDRRSALGAALAGLRFVRRHRGVFALYLLNATVYGGLIVAYALIAPGAPRPGVRLWLTLAIGQLYVFARHYLKLLFYASETAYFQGALAHVSYTAAPAVVWPESPAAEAVLNADSIAR